MGIIDPRWIADGMEMENERAPMCGKPRTLVLFLSCFSLIIFVLPYDSDGA